MKTINTSILSVLTITTLFSFSHAATNNGSCNCVPNNNLQESAVLIVETPIIEAKKVSIKPRKRHVAKHYKHRKTPTPLVNAYCQDPRLPEFIW